MVRATRAEEHDKSTDMGNESHGHCMPEDKTASNTESVPKKKCKCQSASRKSSRRNCTSNLSRADDQKAPLDESMIEDNTSEDGTKPKIDAKVDKSNIH